MNEMSMVEKPGWDLISKYLNNEASFTEKKTVESWANQSEANRKELDNSRRLIKNIDIFYKLKRFNTNTAWKKVAAQIHANHIKIQRNKKFKKEIGTEYYKYASIVLAVLLLIFIGYYFGFQNSTGKNYNEIISPAELIVNEYELPDGSVVSLNCHSKIQFPKQFKKKKREVILIGEAYFDVEFNPEKPFIINAGNVQLKVVGTSFNVSAYPENEKVEVVVETGKVQVSQKDGKMIQKHEEIMLSPGEKGIILQKSNHLKRSRNTDPNYLAWKTHNFVFNKTPLSQVIECLKKVYHIEIELKDNELRELVLSAKFHNKPVDFILDRMQLSFDLDITMRNGNYIISKHKNKKQKKL
jgi:transmembrane sensor